MKNAISILTTATILTAAIAAPAAAAPVMCDSRMQTTLEFIIWRNCERAGKGRVQYYESCVEWNINDYKHGTREGPCYDTHGEPMSQELMWSVINRYNKIHGKPE